MRKREVLEIKKQFRPENLAITWREAWVVNEDKELIARKGGPFLNLPEIEMFKYLELFQKVLSGKIKKNLYDLEFDQPTKKAFLRDVREGRLRDDCYKELLGEIINNYDETGRFAIIIIHGVYDIPGKATDETEMEDASDEVFEYIMTCICPVKMSKKGLAVEEEEIQIAERQWIIGMPDTAFLYPAFTDRSEDLDHVWFYTRKQNDLQEAIIERVLGCKLPKTPETQKEEFLKMAKCEITYKMDEAKRIYQDIQALSIDAELSGQGITRQQLENVLGIEHSEKDEEIILQNVVNLNAFQIMLEDAEISVAADRTDLIEMKEIEGERYVCIKAGGTVFANGMEIENGKTEKENDSAT